MTNQFVLGALYSLKYNVRSPYLCGQKSADTGIKEVLRAVFMGGRGAVIYHDHGNIYRTRVLMASPTQAWRHTRLQIFMGGFMEQEIITALHYISCGKNCRKISIHNLTEFMMIGRRHFHAVCLPLVHFFFIYIIIYQMLK